jgi:phage shock protein PspC (stress-responsive transcriptional regulator)
LEKRLYRSRENAVIGGVCGGIAEYLDVDPTIVRLIWAFSAFYGGIGILAYLVCLIVIPENRSTAQYAPAKPKEPDYQGGQGSTGKQPGAQVQQDTVPQQDSVCNPAQSYSTTIVNSTNPIVSITMIRKDTEIAAETAFLQEHCLFAWEDCYYSENGFIGWTSADTGPYC